MLCIPPTTRHTCDNSGQIVCRMSRFGLPNCTSCLQNFQGPNCNDCSPNYFPPGVCNVHCIPQNNTSGHFTCDPQTGAILCLSGFTDPQTNCTTEGKFTMNFRLVVQNTILNFKLTNHIRQNCPVNAIGQFIFQYCVLWTNNLKFTVQTITFTDKIYI